VIVGRFPEGYKSLGAAQKIIGHEILCDLPTMNNKGFYELYEATGLYLEGEDEAVAEVLDVPGHRRLYIVPT
jgi:hypothetical protein